MTTQSHIECRVDSPSGADQNNCACPPLQLIAIQRLIAASPPRFTSSYLLSQYQYFRILDGANFRLLRFECSVRGECERVAQNQHHQDPRPRNNLDLWLGSRPHHQETVRVELWRRDGIA